MLEFVVGDLPENVITDAEFLKRLTLSTPAGGPG